MQEAIPDPIDGKTRLRNHMRQVLRNHPPCAAHLIDALDEWLAEHPDLATLAIFAGLPDEADLAALVTRHPRRRWVYPRVVGEHLTFHAVTDPITELEPGTFGIREPLLATPEVSVGEIDAFFCPGLAFDRHGGRLGRGRGFYDRILSGARPDALKVGIGSPHQWVSDTFPQPHDIRMDVVIAG